MKSYSVPRTDQELLQLLDEVTKTQEAVRLKGRSSSAVLVSEKKWRSVLETIHLSTIPGMTKSIADGLNTPLNETEEDL